MSSTNNKHPAEHCSLDEPNSKKVKIAGEESSEPDLKATQNLEDIESIQDELVKLNEKESEEMSRIEQKFSVLRKPYYEKRQILLKNIPQFWLQTLYNHPNISSMIASEEEEDCLNFLTDLEVEKFDENKNGYKIKLHFADNPYFKNDVLIKDIHNVAEFEQAAESTPIEYKDTDKGKSLKQNVEKVLEELKYVNDQKQCSLKSFFAWFLDPVEAGIDEISELIKDHIWRNPLEFYLAQDQGGSDNSEDSDDDLSEEYEEDDSNIIQEGELQEIDEEDDEEGDAGSGEEVEEFQQDEGEGEGDGEEDEVDE